MIVINSAARRPARLTVSLQAENLIRLHSLALALLLGVAANAYAQDTGTGQSLRDTHCQMGHGTQPYTREDRAANSWVEIRAEVNRWRKAVSLNWSGADIDDVTDFIAVKYYWLDCPHKC